MTIIKVEAAHIRAGKPMAYDACPIWYAVRNVTARQFKPEVFERRIVFRYYDIQVASVPLPAEVTEWVRSFDRNGKVEPIEFEIEIEKELLRK